MNLPVKPWFGQWMMSTEVRVCTREWRPVDHLRQFATKAFMLKDFSSSQDLLSEIFLRPTVTRRRQRGQTMAKLENFSLQILTFFLNFSQRLSGIKIPGF